VPKKFEESLAVAGTESYEEFLRKNTSFAL
jgi:hypothetical protein